MSFTSSSPLARAGHLLGKISNLVSIGPKWIGLSMLVMMMSLVTGDVILRAVFNWPIPGTYELIQFMMVVLIFFALSYTAIKDNHVTVDLVFDRISPRGKAVMDSFAYLLSFALFVFISWQSILQGLYLMDAEEVSIALSIPSYPFAFVVALGSALLCLVLLTKFIESLTKVSRR